ncbi:FAD-dependent pyridine nucleotide-disulfide oxidoreductase, partial [Penicillium taxi]|uniref:FAD-dependent pyridine nucleotide-disulfide oxidoreductase n=1 Tax=Penicillium taxi TaxID=168475 RepID=UPI002545372F
SLQRYSLVTMFMKTGFLSLLTLASAVSVPQTDYDVIIVGGGPAGLSALSGVSRVQRTALLFDNQQYRNAPTREMHDVIGNDGTPPATFRGLAREQISKYDTAHFKNQTVESIIPLDGDFSAFIVTDDTGSNFTARKIVLGTGLKDLLPSTPGLQDAFGKGIFWCPWCDGHEHRDQSFGIVASVENVLGAVLEVHTLNNDIIAFTNGTRTPANEAKAEAKSQDWNKQLEAWNVTIDDRTISSFERTQDGSVNRDEQGKQYDMFLIRFTEGDPVERNAFLVDFPTNQTSTLPYEMGLEIDNSKIKVASSMRTNETGVFAIGDANSDGSTNVPHAMFSGKRAAVYIHVEMSREESKSKISKREGNISLRDLEKEANSAIGDNLEREWRRALIQE